MAAWLGPALQPKPCRFWKGHEAAHEVHCSQGPPLRFDSLVYQQLRWQLYGAVGRKPIHSCYYQRPHLQSTSSLQKLYFSRQPAVGNRQIIRDSKITRPVVPGACTVDCHPACPSAKLAGSLSFSSGVGSRVSFSHLFARTFASQM